MDWKKIRNDTSIASPNMPLMYAGREKTSVSNCTLWQGWNGFFLCYLCDWFNVVIGVVDGVPGIMVVGM